MALIGEMDYLTIGGNTYSIPKYSLPIASASTLGGVRVGTGLTIESGTGILSATGTDVTIDSEMSDSSHNPVQNQTIKAYIDQYKGTVTSVRVQATSPVQSSVSTAQNETLNTTISLANGYGDTKNPYGTKTANYVLAGPTSGSAAAPSFRKLVAADIPDLSGTYLTSSDIADKVDKFIVHLGEQISGDYYQIDKTYQQVALAALAGSQLIFTDMDITYPYLGVANMGNALVIGFGFSATYNGTAMLQGYMVLQNDTAMKLNSTTSIPTQVSDLTNDAGYITSADVPEGASAYTGTISAVGTTASNGTNNGFARGDHVHNITSSTITSALGYTPYDSTNPNGYISSYTDEKLKWTASTSSNTYYPLQSTSTATTSTANTLNGISFYQYYNTAGGYRRLDLGNSTAYKSTGGAYGTIRLYGAAATYYGDLVPGVLGTTSGDGHISANRTWTLPDKTGIIALISDIPTTLPASDVSAWAKASSKPTYTASEVGALASDTTYVSTITTTAGTHTAISNKSGAVSFNVPTKTSHLTNDSGFITSDSDENVKSTTVTAATTNYIVGSTSSSTTTGGLSKHASALIYTTADSGTSGYAELRLGNTTATSSAGGKEGRIRLYGTNATYYITLQAGAIASSNKTITFPNATGTVALTSDIVDENVKITALTAASIYYLTGNNSFVTNTGGLNMHPSANISVDSNSSTNGYTRLELGNSTAGTTAGGKEGIIRLYGSSTSYTDLKVGASTSVKTITFPDKTGTVALTSDIPTVPTKTSDLTNDSGFITSDTKVSIESVNPETSTTYYPTIYTNYTATSKTLMSNAYTRYWINQGTASAEGSNWLALGNNTAKGTAGNQTGALRLYGAGGGYGNLYYDTEATTAATHYLPSTPGTILNSGTTSFTQSLTSGTTVGTIKINGTSTTLYAPTNTDSKVLQSATTTDGWRKILLHYDYQTDKAAAVSSATEQVRASQYASIRPSDGSLYLGGALTSSRINSLITGGTQTGAVTTSPYKPALWKFDAGITPTNGDVVFIQAPGGGHSYGEFLSLDNGTTYKPITHSGTSKMTTHYESGSPIMLVYDSDWSAASMYPLAGGTSTGTISGGAWRVVNGYLDGNHYTQAYCTTAAATAAKTAGMTGYSATANRYVMVNMYYANTAASAITLNINGTGAKPIYINSSASSTSNYTLPAGSYLVYYDGTNYYFRTDGYMTVKYAVQAPSSETTFMPVLARSGVDIVNRIHEYTRLWIKAGSTSADGYVYLGLGNNTATGTNANSFGVLRLYSVNTGYSNLRYISATNNVDNYLPSTSGTLLNTGTTSFTQSLTSGTEVGTIKINGVDTKLYAPTNTDTKVSITATNPASGTWYYPVWHTAASGTSVTLNANTGFLYYTSEGTTSAIGHGLICAGNDKGSGTAGNKRGRIRIFSSGTGYGDLYYSSTTASNNTSHYLPSTGGTLLNTDWAYLTLGTSETLYTAISNLGWTSDVIS